MKTKCIKNDVIIIMDSQEYNEFMETLKNSKEFLVYQMYYKFEESEVK